MVMGCLRCSSSFWTYLILVVWFIKFCEISFGNREGYFGICDLNNCSGCESHFVHILGCKQRPWFQLLGAFLVWCCICAHSFCPDSGTWTSLPRLASDSFSYQFLFIDFDFSMPGFSSCRCSFPWVRSQLWSTGVLHQSYSLGTSYTIRITWSRDILTTSTFGLPSRCILISSISSSPC